METARLVSCHFRWLGNPPPLPPTLCARESRAENTAMGVDFLKAERNTPGGDGEGREKYPWIVSENPILTSITGVEAWRGVAWRGDRGGR